ncbi:hypothetical protein OZX59_06440 [Lactobacillus sp. ESL0681]|nr:hypothetical protein [Lactobacillus sp. ESL0681]WEV41239.1 hypothetical protein OZX59_06440 [Lactobacillus sp. ESL0681]
MCLLPASGWLYFYQIASQSSFGNNSYLFLLQLLVIVVFAIYLLVTANNQRWTKPKNLQILMIFSLLCVSFIVFIPIYLAYSNCKKLNR